MSEQMPSLASGAQRRLGGSGISVPALGVGTNRWTATGPDQARYRDALTAAVDAGMAFIDTAEVYGFGKSEIAVGRAARADGRPIVLASKFAPLPYRLSAAQFATALGKTLERLDRESLDLYYLHFPYSPLGIGTWMRAMADAVKSGRIRAVGISNCNVAQMRTAAAVLGRYDVPLAADQVHYSLLHRAPESNGVLDACRRMDVALVAYRPLAGGTLVSDARESSQRSTLADTLRAVAAARKATAAQVALAWLLQRDSRVILIPGATRAEHVHENAGALSLKLSDEEFAAIDRASASAPT